MNEGSIVGTFIGELTFRKLCIANEANFGIMHVKNLWNNVDDGLI